MRIVCVELNSVAIWGVKAITCLAHSSEPMLLVEMHAVGAVYDHMKHLDAGGCLDACA